MLWTRAEGGPVCPALPAPSRSLFENLAHEVISRPVSFCSARTGGEPRGAVSCQKPEHLRHAHKPACTVRKCLVPLTYPAKHSERFLTGGLPSQGRASYHCPAKGCFVRKRWDAIRKTPARGHAQREASGGISLIQRHSLHCPPCCGSRASLPGRCIPIPEEGFRINDGAGAGTCTAYKRDSGPSPPLHPVPSPDWS